MISFRQLSESLADIDTTPVELDEAINTFNELPAAWKKHATTQGFGGQGSTVQTLASSTKALKTVDAIEKQLRIALNPGKRVEGGSTLIWVELNGDPIMSVYRPASEENTVYLSGPEGKPETVRKSDKRHGTGKWDSRTQKYVPAEYYHYDQRSMKPTEALSIMFQAVNKTIRAMNDSLEEPHKDHFDVITADNVKIEIKSLTVDQNRVATKQARVAARGKGVQVYKNKVTVNRDDLKANRKTVLKKWVGEKITPVVDEIKTDILTQIDNAISTGGKIDLKGVEQKLQQISSITRDLNRLTSGEDVSFSRNAQWGTSGHKTLDYGMSSLVDSLKRLEGKEDA